MIISILLTYIFTVTLVIIIKIVELTKLIKELNKIEDEQESK